VSMSKEAVKDKMKDLNVMVLDVLPESDYRKLHIEGSESLPLGLSSDDFVEAVEKRYGKDKFFITYCAGLTCHAGPDAAKALQKKGFKANDYAGGMQDWSESGFPVAGTDAKKSAVA
jgi:rhodanese-related sulfurtransferase